MKGFLGEVQKRTGSYPVACESQRFFGAFGLMMLGVEVETLFCHVPSNLSLHYPQSISEKGVTRLGGWKWRGKVSSWAGEGEELQRRLLPHRNLKEGLQNIGGKIHGNFKGTRIGS